MHVYILFAHPASTSFSREILREFTRGLRDSKNSFEIADLYEMKFNPELDFLQYRREVGMDPDAPVPDDVKKEQEKIDKADALVFIYPVWWSDCPAIMKGWFDRVLTYGYAYFYDQDDQRFTRINIEKGLVVCSAGHTMEHLEETGIAEAMRRIMLNDRLLGVGVREAEMVILGGMMPGDDTCREKNLKKAFQLGKDF